MSDDHDTEAHAADVEPDSPGDLLPVPFDDVEPEPEPEPLRFDTELTIAEALQVIDGAGKACRAVIDVEDGIAGPQLPRQLVSLIDDTRRWYLKLRGLLGPLYDVIGDDPDRECLVTLQSAASCVRGDLVLWATRGGDWRRITRKTRGGGSLSLVFTLSETEHDGYGSPDRYINPPDDWCPVVVRARSEGWD